MPITVKHGEDFGALAALALLAGAGQRRAPEIPRISVGRGGGGGGGGGGGRVVHSRGPRLEDYGRIRYPSSRERMIREAAERKAEQDIQQEAAQQAAVVTEATWTPEQRREWSRLENSKQVIMTDPTFSEDERQKALTDVSLRQMKLRPVAKPKDPNKPVYPEGQDVGQMWVDQMTGAVMTREPDGTPKLVQRFDQGPEAKRLEAETRIRIKELEIQEKQVDARQKRAEEIRKFAYDLKSEGGVSSEDIRKKVLQRFGKSSYDEYFGTREQVSQGQSQEEILESVLRQKVGERKLREQAAADQEPSAPSVPRELIGWSKQMGVKATREDADLPEFVGMAQAFLREVRDRSRRGQKIPPEMTGPIQEAKAIIMQYRELIKGS